MPLTDLKIRKAKPRTKPYKMADGGGLFLLVKPGGGKLWQQKFRFLGKEGLLSHGKYPAVTLAQARQKREDALLERDQVEAVGFEGMSAF